MIISTVGHDADAVCPYWDIFKRLLVALATFAFSCHCVVIIGMFNSIGMTLYGACYDVWIYLCTTGPVPFINKCFALAFASLATSAFLLNCVVFDSIRIQFYAVWKYLLSNYFDESNIKSTIIFSIQPILGAFIRKCDGLEDTDNYFVDYICEYIFESLAEFILELIGKISSTPQSSLMHVDT